MGRGRKGACDTQSNCVGEVLSELLLLLLLEASVEPVATGMQFSVVAGPDVRGGRAPDISILRERE